MNKTQFDALMARITTINASTSLANEHKSMNAMIDSVVFAVCMWKYDALKRAVQTAVTAKNNLLAPMVTGFTDITSLTDAKTVTTMSQLIVACNTVIARMVQKKNKTYYAMEGVNARDGFSAPINFKLREEIYQKVALREIQQPDDNTYKYAKRLVVEMFLVSFYPYIHLQYVNELLNRFKKEGDFVNMRAMALVRVMFAVNALFYVHSKGNELNMTAAQSTSIKNILDVLKTYTSKITQVDFSNERIGLGDIMIELHEKSADVKGKSMSIDALKGNITTNQLQIRGILAAYASSDKAFKTRRTEFTLLTVAFIALIVISMILIQQGLFVDELMYVLAGIIATIIAVKLVMLIIALAK
jgi:hypothetical protein